MNQRIVDEVNAICMAARRAKAAKARALAGRYSVDYGYQQSRTMHFVTFPEALAFYAEHLDDGRGLECAPKLLGFAHDDESDGLTDDERELVESLETAEHPDYAANKHEARWGQP